MANTTISPNMNLPIPVVGVDPGPDWASNINASLTLVDQHNHAPGNGVQINPSGININAVFSVNGNSVTNIGALTLTIQSAAAANNSVYNNAGDLYFVDNLGNNIQITKNGTVAGSSGTITGLPSGTASASYAAGTFVFQSATSTSANIDAGSYVLRNNTANSFGLTLQPPSALSSNYSITLPNLPSVSASPLLIDTSGNVTAATPSSYVLPAGMIMMFGGASTPSGWLFCDGSAVSRTTFSSLFGAIGTTFGPGDGSTTFNIPNTQGLFPRGNGTQVVDGITYASFTGQVLGDTFQGHYHQRNSSGLQEIPLAVTAGTSNYAAGGTLGGPGDTSVVVQAVNDGTNGIPRTATETKPAMISFNFIIKT